jgi:hypothetical protein
MLNTTETFGPRDHCKVGDYANFVLYECIFVLLIIASIALGRCKHGSTKISHPLARKALLFLGRSPARAKIPRDIILSPRVLSLNTANS